MSYAVSRGRGKQSPLALALGVAVRRRTYRNLLYLLASFPLGTAYFVFLVTSIAVGLGTLVVWVGVPILLFTVLAWWALGAFERELAIWWLGVDIRPMARPRETGLKLSQRLRAHLSNQVTWTSLVYLLVKFPLGLLSFTVAAGAIFLTAKLLTLPLAYFVAGTAGAAPGALGALGALAGPPLGVAFGLLALHVVNGLAVVWGRFARLMLGLSDVAARLTETTALAEREQAKAARSEQSRRELIVNVSHELRTPTASIRGHVESLLIALDERGADGVPPAELRAYLDIIHRETERLGALVNDLLPLARAEAGELRLDLAPVAADQVVEEVCESLAPLARRERSIALVCTITPGLPPVLADRQRLSQVLLNLARNAITYTPTGGIVSIALEPGPPGRVALTVADTGIGIPPEDLERVFERFYRTDASRARTSGGFGLGLAIVRDLVGAMGGAVTAESTPGEGSRFRVLLREAGSRVGG